MSAIINREHSHNAKDAENRLNQFLTLKHDRHPVPRSDFPEKVYSNSEARTQMGALPRPVVSQTSPSVSVSESTSDYLISSMWLSNAIFINRTNRADAMKTFQKAAKDMKERKMSIFIFAEGTRTNSPDIGMLPFKKGAFHLAVQGGFPIVPMVCENYYSLYASGIKKFEAGELVVRGKFCLTVDYLIVETSLIPTTMHNSITAHLYCGLHILARRYCQTERQGADGNAGSTGRTGGAQKGFKHTKTYKPKRAVWGDEPNLAVISQLNKLQVLLSFARDL